MKKWLFLIIALLPLGAHAEFDWFMDANLGFGGDTMAEVEVETYGGDIDESKIKAGEGLGLALGGRFDVVGNIDVALSVGYKFGGVLASNGSATFDRVPLTAMIFYDFGKVQLGLGATRETNANLDLEDAGGPDVDVEDADGEMVALLWDASDSFSWGLRYTQIDYELSNFTNTYNGDHFDLQFSFSF